MLNTVSKLGIPVEQGAGAGGVNMLTAEAIEEILVDNRKVSLLYN